MDEIGEKELWNMDIGWYYNVSIIDDGMDDGYCWVIEDMKYGDECDDVCVGMMVDLDYGNFVDFLIIFLLFLEIWKEYLFVILELRKIVCVFFREDLD